MAMRALTSYQNEIARAVLDSVLNGRGLTFTVELPRGGGARELSAQVERVLLTLHVNDGASLLRVAPASAPAGTHDTREQLIGSLARGALQGLWSAERRSVRLGRSTLRYVGVDELGPTLMASTADLGLIEVAEAQLVSDDAYDRWIEPLAEVSGATTVLYGQPLNGETWFEQAKLRNREAELRDGVQRHFRVCAEQVAEELPGFRAGMAEARARLGEAHPEFQSAYLLRPTMAATPLLAHEALAGIEDGQRTHHRDDATSVVASVVVTRLPDASMAPVQLLRDPGASAVVTIAERDGAGGLRVVDHRWIQGIDAGSLARRVAKVLGEWRPERTLGEDRTPFDRSQTESDSFRLVLQQALGFLPLAWVRGDDASASRRLSDLLAALHVGRLTTYRFDGSVEYRALRRELADATADYTDEGQLRLAITSGDEGFLRGLVLLVRTTAPAQLPVELLETALAS
jgi:hypothetical protein